MSLSEMILTGQVPNINTISNCPVKFTEDPFEYVESNEFLNLKLKKKQKFLLEKTYEKDEDAIDKYNVIVVIAGMRSGKSVFGAFIGGFELQKLLSNDSPQEKYGLIPGDEIFIVNTANSLGQSEDTIFAKLAGHIDKLKYWQKYISWLKKRELKERNLRRYSLFSSAGTYIKFKQQNITIRAEHSNSASLAGKTIKLYLSDEICRADTSKEEIQLRSQKRSAQAVFNTLQKGTQTFGMEGKTVVVSSPYFEDDYGMQLFYSCKTIHVGETKSSEVVKRLREISKKPKVETYIGFHYTSREMNPELEERTLNSEKQRSIRTYRRDYEAWPPKTSSPFFQNDKVIESSTIKKPEIVVFKDIEIVDILENNRGREERSFIGKELVSIKPDKLTKRFICCDQGESNCAFIVGMAHGEEREISYSDSKMKRLITCIDLILPYYPKKDKRVSFKNVEDVIKELNKYYFIQAVTYDRWQSTSSLQELFRVGIHSEILGATYKMYEDLYNDMFLGIVEIPDMEDVKEELKKLSEVKRKIMPPKDIADVIVRLNHMVRVEENLDFQNNFIMEPKGSPFVRNRKNPSNLSNISSFKKVPEGIWNKTGSKTLWTPFRT